MKLKSDLAVLLLAPLCGFIYFWIQETILLYNNRTVKYIGIISYTKGDDQIIDKEKITGTLSKIIFGNEKMDVDKARHEIKEIYGVKDCYITIGIEGSVNVVIIPVTIIARYNDTDKRTYYIDSDWNFIQSSNIKTEYRNIIEIDTKNIGILKEKKYQEKINQLLTSFENYVWKIEIQDDNEIKLHSIICDDIYSLNLHDKDLDIKCCTIKQKIYNH